MLETAAKHLATHGYEAMSVAAVAAEAGTTRQALYRRWAGKPELAAAAMAAYADHATDTSTADPYADLVAELTDFQRSMSRSGRLSLVGTMLQDHVEANVHARTRPKSSLPDAVDCDRSSNEPSDSIWSTPMPTSKSPSPCPPDPGMPVPSRAGHPPGTGHSEQQHSSRAPLAASHHFT